MGKLSSPKGLVTPRESGSESEKDQRTSEKDQKINGKLQRNFSLSRSLSFGLNIAYVFCRESVLRTF